MTAPSDSDTLFGSGMSSASLVEKLQKINKTVWIEDRYRDGVWYPGKSVGLTCIWYGVRHDTRRSKKISGVIPGVIPEFTQIDEKGFIMHLGWRRILEKSIKYGAARRADVERVFGVTLDISDDVDGWCPDCKKAGRNVKSTGSMNLCHFHTKLVGMVANARQSKRDLSWLERKLGCPQLLSKAKSSLKDSQIALA